jgi:hypothetical protein
MDAAGDIFSGLLELLAEVVIRLLELLFYVVENIVYGVLWLCRCSKFAGPRRKKGCLRRPGISFAAACIRCWL